MAHILQIGCGDLGSLLVQGYLQAGHQVTVFRQSPIPAPTGAQTLYGNIVTQQGLDALSALDVDIVVYCVAPPAGDAQSYEQYYYQGLKHVLSALRLTSLQHVFFVSSTRVYGENAGGQISDTDIATPADRGGEILLAAESLLDTLPCGHTALRLSGIYGPNRLYLLRMAQDVAKWPATVQWTNRIHEQDVVGFALHLIARLSSHASLASHYIVTDSLPVKQHKVLTWIAQQLGWKLGEPPASQEMYGKRLLNQGLIDSGYRLQYANYQLGYAQVIQHYLQARESCKTVN
jgi:nucleoside-diphosphate-sugar epimerase